METGVGRFEIAASLRLVRYHSTVRRRPSSSDTAGSKPSRRRALEMSACESRTSPARGSAYTGFTCAPTIARIVSNRAVERDAAAGRDVDHLAAGVRRLAGPQHAVDDVGDVGEVARLLAVAVDGRRPSVEQRRREQRDHARVGRRGILPRAEHVEVADADGLEAVEPGEHPQVLLAHQLLQRVGRQRIASACPRASAASACRRTPTTSRRRRGAGRRRRARRRARSACASTLARFEVSGSATDRGTDGIAAWCST